jgi:hypothetical protein
MPQEFLEVLRPSRNLHFVLQIMVGSIDPILDGVDGDSVPSAWLCTSTVCRVKMHKGFASN